MAPGLSMLDIIQQSASVLRQDSTITMRSNMEALPDRQNPLFPLRQVRMEELEEEGTPRRLTEEAAKGAFQALNHLAGFGASKALATSTSSPSVPAHEDEHGLRSRAEKSVSRLVQRNHMWGVSNEEVNFDSFFKGRGVNYQGDEIKTAQKLSWEAVKQSLPEEVGSLPLADFCRLGTLAYIQDFEKYLVPEEARIYTTPPRVMVQEGQWEALATGLLERGIAEAMPLEKVYHLKGQPVLNGLFAVGKGEYVNGTETQRLIMNLTPVNALCRSLAGDVGTLPALSGMNGYILDDGEVVLLSSEDIRCFFYLFAVPQCWKSYLGFNRLLPETLVPERWRGQPCVLVSKVLPMGFVNSVSIAQHIHRNVVRLSAQHCQPVIGGECELRKDKGLSNSSLLFRTYLDNFDCLERVQASLAECIKGTVAGQVEQLREAYEALGLPRHPKKAVQRSSVGEMQGALFDGERGFAMAKPAKVVQYCRLGFELLQRGQSTLRELQVVCGGFVYLCMFRRALLCSLNAVFEHMRAFESEAPVVRLSLPYQVKVEIARFILLAPLAQMEFRAKVDGEVTCSDASSYGGGLCATKGLSEFGHAALNSCCRGDLPEEHDLVQVLSIGLFDGIGALRVACDVLGLPMAGHVSIEQNPHCRRVVESFFPECDFFDDVTQFGEEEILHLSLKYSNVGLIIVGAGPPCQGVSGLNADRQGALRDARSSLFQEIPRITSCIKRIFHWAQVHELVENVASMSEADRVIMSRKFERAPFRIDLRDISLCSRPRLYWVTWELRSGSGASVTEPVGDSYSGCGSVRLWGEVEAKAFLQPGWSLMEGGYLPTFTTSRPRDGPGRRPAGIEGCQEHEKARWAQDAFRFPPYQYKDANGLWSKRGEWRRPDSTEREACLGFPVGYTRNCVPKGQQQGEAYEDIRLTLLGNSWHVAIVAWLIQQLTLPLGLCKTGDLQQLLRNLTPGQASDFSTMLTRPPLHGRHALVKEADTELLVKKLIGLSSMKGEDLMVQSGSDPAPRYFRLRASVPGRLWKWREISGWRWKHSGEHINALELRAILTSIKWKIWRRKRVGMRILHLTDSLVCLHALTRGRSSSRRLRPIIMQLNSYLLAADLRPLWGYIHTSLNPANRPSRRPLRKKWLK